MWPKLRRLRATAASLALPVTTDRTANAADDSVTQSHLMPLL
jgi:hypothetical protein